MGPKHESEPMDKMDDRAEAAMGQEDADKGVEPEEIEPITVEFAHEDFPKLDYDEEGDSVMALVMGKVVKKGKDSCVVEFDKAAVIHGKMTQGQKKRVMKLEDVLAHKPGVENKYALARHIVLKKKGGK